MIVLGGFVSYAGGYIDEFGKRVSRPITEYPYSYDGFVLWRGRPQVELKHTLYSDRLSRQYHKEWNALYVKHFGQSGDNFSERNPTKIESFLRELTDTPDLKLGLIMQYCNFSNGFPVWRFDY